MNNLANVTAKNMGSKFLLTETIERERCTFREALYQRWSVRSAWLTKASMFKVTSRSILISTSVSLLALLL